MRFLGSNDRKNEKRVFYHKSSIRSILNINMHEVEAHRSTNEQVRKKFLNVPDIIDVIHCRQLTWIGKVARMGMGEERAPRRLIQTLWWDKPRKEGRPQCTCQNSYAEAIAKVIPSLPQDARLQQWIPIAKEAIAKWWSTVTADWREGSSTSYSCVIRNSTNGYIFVCSTKTAPMGH
jgi:hypothetical protein